jgi:hypothetical protein
VSIYRYKNSIIDELSFKKTANGAIRAYLHARDGTDAAEVQNALEVLKNKDFECIPFTLDGKPTLEVRGFKNEKEFLRILAKQEWTQGKAAAHTPDPTLSYTDRVKGRSLQLSGVLYSVGDVGFIGYGWKGQSWKDVVAGISYAIGTGALVGYGRNDQSGLQIKDFSRQLAKHLMKQSVTLPENCSLAAIARDKEKGLLTNVHELLTRYPTEIYSLFTGIAGAFVAAAAHEHKVKVSAKYKHAAVLPSNLDRKAVDHMRISGWLDIGLGTITMASTAIGGLVQEKAHDPDKPKEKGIKGALEWVQERPLTISGIGLMISTSLHAISTFMDYRTAKRLGNNKRMLDSIPYRAGFVIANLAAEALIAISSKGHGEGVVSDKSVDNSVIAIAADLIVRQPRRLQDAMVPEVAKFLGRPDVLAMKDAEVTTMLHNQVEALRKNPWAVAEGEMPDQTSVLATPAKKEPAAWRNKLAAAPSASPQLSA